MDLADELLELKHEVEEAQQKADKAQGAFDQVMKQLKEEFKCKTLVEANEALKKLNKHKVTQSKKFQEKLEAFKEKWSDRLEEDED